ncbi:MAG: pyruvate dehydrogenase complex dihydrolipoamide acetyltransferase, partial [Geminicoccaceae bacterium]|nr:pyruvate dehydrogenase complex dihydrolipoamide acetyltransferase [Geminicoccaceae bacterium]
EAVDEGTIGKIVVPEGTEGVAVNQVIALLLEEGEDAAALKDAGGAKPAPAPDGGKMATAGAPGEGASPSTTPPAEDRAKEYGQGPATLPVKGEGAAKEGQQGRAKGDGAAVGDLPGGPLPEAKGSDGKRLFASPLAKRLAQMEGIDLAAVQGTGPHGRIVKADVLKAKEAGGAKAKPQAAPEAGKPAAEAPQPAAAPIAPAASIAPPQAPHEEIKLSNMRKTIAKRLAEAKREIPHFYLTVDVELDELLAMRKQFNARDGADYKLSVNDFVIKAVAAAMKRKPDVNAMWGGDKVYQLKEIDVAVAVAIEGGLITPIIRRADQKGLATLSNEMKDLAKRARDGKLKPEEYQGGGFSVSNLGMYGIREFSAVINPPQSCILAVGAGEQRAVVKNGAVAVATVMSCTLSVDHRVVDGALGAEWLAEFKKLIEDPLALLL